MTELLRYNSSNMLVFQVETKRWLKPFSGDIWKIIAAFFLVTALVGFYCYKTGLVIFMGDSWLFADRTKHLLYTGNFDTAGGIVYPPLFSLLLVPAYLFRNPEISLAIARCLNVVIYSSAFFPIYLLLRTYSGLGKSPSIALGVLFALAPNTLPYASMFLYDALFYVLFLWFCFSLVKAWQDPSMRNFLLAGIFLALCMLTRELAKNLVLCFCLVGISDVIRQQVRTSKGTKRAGLYLTSLAVLLIFYGSWLLLEYFFVTYSDGVYQYRILAKTSELNLRLSWFLNLLAYFITAPLSASTVFVLFVAFLKPRLLYEDLFLLFILFVVAGASMSLVLVMRKDWAPADICGNRYLALYITPFFLAALRYREYLTLRFFLAILALSCLLLLVGWPAGIKCHFPDSLAAFNRTINPAHLSPFLLNAVYAVMFIVTTGLFLRESPLLRKMAFVLFCLIFFTANVASSLVWGIPNHFNLKSYKGIYQTATSIFLRERHISLYYDPNVNSKDLLFLPIKRYFFYFPFFVSARSETEVRTMVKNSGVDVYFLTDRYIPRGAEKLAKDETGFFLYRFSGSSLHAVNELSADFITESTHTDISLEGMRPHSEGPYPPDLPRIRWANRPSVRMSFDNTDELNLTRINLRGSFSPYGQSTRSLSLILNGKLIRRYDIIPTEAWQDFDLLLEPHKGMNFIELVFDRPGPLSDQREVLYMLFRDLRLRAIPSS